MSGGWEGSDRRSRLPDNWGTIVDTVKRRAATVQHPFGQCEAIRSKTHTRCTKAGTDVDHLIPGDDHSMDNLQLLCRWHHAAKSSREGNDAQAQRRATTRRAPERHPGVRG